MHSGSPYCGRVDTHGRCGRVKKLQSMHVFQRYDEVRERRILTRHEKRQAEWETFRQRMIKRRGQVGKKRGGQSGHMDPDEAIIQRGLQRADELVFDRMESYRMMLEEKALLAKATPIEKRHGGNVWQMSLRDAWTAYISIGGQFSGLEMPVEDRPELQPETMYSVRKPFATTSLAERRIQRIRRITRDDPSVEFEPFRIDVLKSQYSEAIKVLQPAEVEFDDLHITGVGLEQQYEYMLVDVQREKAEREEQERKEAEKRARSSQRFSQTRSRANTSDTSETSRSARSQGSQLSRSASATQTNKPGGAETAAIIARGIEFQPHEPDEDRPCMQFESDRLVMEASTGELTEVTLSCANIGNCAVFYKWVRSNDDPLQRYFSLKDMAGSILPGDVKDFVFTFKSDMPGAFSETWSFQGRPNVQDTAHTVTLKGFARFEDKTKEKRARLEMDLEHSLKIHTVEEVMDEVVDHVGTPRAKARELLEDPDMDRQDFIRKNKEAQIYYSNTTLKLFQSLADSTFELLDFPRELREWNYSLESLKTLIGHIDDDGERERHIIQFNEIMKVAGIPPTSTSMFNSICYELVAELADSIPDLADSIRIKLELPRKSLKFKEKETRDLVYTMDPKTMSTWRYDPHLLRIGGPPVPYTAGPLEAYPEEEVVTLHKTVDIEVWELEEDEAPAEGEEGEDSRPRPPERDSETEGRLEFEYLLRLNDGVYHQFACLTERLALLSAEADLRSQVIAQVVLELNAAASEEVRTLIREDKMDEARKIDPAKYQGIVDIDMIFRKVMEEEQELQSSQKAAEARRQSARDAEAAAAASAAAAGDASVGPGVPISVAVR